MKTTRCPYCRGSVQAGSARCIWCNADLAKPPPTLAAGDVIRIRNPFKGGRIEDVTVVQVLRDGWALEVRDAGNLTWGYIKPEHIIEVYRQRQKR